MEQKTVNVERNLETLEQKTVNFEQNYTGAIQISIIIVSTAHSWLFEFLTRHPGVMPFYSTKREGKKC